MKDPKTIHIDFNDIEGPVYSGRDRGERLRQELHIADADANSAQVLVEIPESTYSITSSFFLGLFGPSIVGAGSKDAFFKRFSFKSPDFLIDTIDRHVDRVFLESGLPSRQ